MSNSRLLLVHTGGTLGMTPVSNASLVPGPSLARILEQVPELQELADLRLVVAWNQDSSVNEPEDILELARIIRSESADCMGVVVIHGTDTMAFTAAMLGFLLADLGKPVVLTGSQRPLAYVRSDARSNLIDAVTLATKGIAEVGVCFGDQWYRGVAVDKLSVHQYAAFASPNLPPLAEMGIHVRIHPHAGHFERWVPSGVGEAFENAIAHYSPFPGMAWFLPPAGTKGVIIQGYGAGNLPMGRRDLLALLGHCRTHEIPVIMLSQCPWGGVDLAAYDLGQRAQELGVISGGTHTKWAALAKLGLCLSLGSNVEVVRKAFATSWAGEPI